MRKPINRLNFQTRGLLIRWECPRGHSEEDETPLDKFAYCRACATTYFWDEVTRRGPFKQITRAARAEAAR